MTTIFCRVCEQHLPTDSFFSGLIKPTVKRLRCRRCTAIHIKAWRQRNPAKQQAIRARSYAKNLATHLRCSKEWRAKNPERDRLLRAIHQRRIKQFTPPWADRAKIRALYREAQRLTRETGIEHQVDHIYPLRGKTSCGLHVHYNLQIITGTANRKKFNNLPEEIGCVVA